MSNDISEDGARGRKNPANATVDVTDLLSGDDARDQVKIDSGDRAKTYEIDLDTLATAFDDGLTKAQLNFFGNSGNRGSDGRTTLELLKDIEATGDNKRDPGTFVDDGGIRQRLELFERDAAGEVAAADDLMALIQAATAGAADLDLFVTDRGFDIHVGGRWSTDVLRFEGDLARELVGDTGPVADPITAVRIDGIDPGDRSGRPVSSAGDVDGDGLDDILIGASGGDPDGTAGAGESYLVFGKALVASGGTIDLATLTSDQGVLIEGAEEGDRSGRSAAAAGDVDGDGKADILIGARSAGRDGSDGIGETYLVFGKALAASDGTIDLATLTSDQGVLIRGIDALDGSGWSVATAGDVDGDGKDDILISAPFAASGDASSAGETYLVFGAALETSGGTIDLAALTSDQGILIRGVDAFDESGRSVASAGDVDGDGLDDVLIGAPLAGPDGLDLAGETYLLFGKALEASGGTIDLATLTPDQGVLIEGAEQDDESGRSVAAAGDVDGDGLGDILIGAPSASPDGAEFAGETYLVFGKAIEASGGTIDLATLTPDQGVRIEGIDADDESGRSVASAGDVDGDGLDDILIGSLFAEPAGETYLVFGSALEASGGTIDLATLTPDQGVLVKGADEDDQSGFSVAAAGDVDGDGLDDILIGAPGGDPGDASSAGESYVLSGALLTAEKGLDGVIGLGEPDLFI